MNRYVTSVVMLMVMSMAAGVKANDNEWSKLPVEIKEVLLQFEASWAQIPGSKQQKLIEGAKRWINLDKQQRQEFSQRYQRWNELEQEDKEYFASLWEGFKKLSPYKQNRARLAFKRFRSFSQNKKEELWAQWQRVRRENRIQYVDNNKGVTGNISKGRAIQNNAPIRAPIVQTSKPLSTASSKKKDR